MDYGPDGLVDYAADAAVDYDASHLWITRVRLAVDYAADAAVDYACWRMLWITGLSALWISQHSVLGRIYPGFALWISGGVGAGDIVAPSHCGGGESCTLRILRMLLLASREKRAR